MTADAATRGRPNAAGGDKVLQRLDKLLPNGTAASSGQLMMLGLEDVRAQVGEADWPRIERHIDIAIERQMSRLLGPGDRLIRVPPDSYLAVIVSRDFDGAVALMHHACHVLTSHFFGKESLGQVRFEAVVSDLEEGAEPRSVHVGADDEDDEPPHGQVDAPEWENPAEVRPALQAVSYLPVWDAYHGVLSTFMAGMWRRADRGRLAEGPEFDDGQHGALEQARADALILRSGVAVLDDLYDNAFALLIAVPVHHRTLASALGRAIFAEACRDIPEHLRKLISFRVFGVPEDMAPHMLTDRLKPLKTFARAVGLQLNDWNLRTQRLAGNAAVDLISFDLPGIPAEDARLLDALPEMVALARENHRLTACGQIRTVEQLRAARRAGAVFLSGPAVGMACPMPGNMIRCALDELPYRCA